MVAQGVWDALVGVQFPAPALTLLVMLFDNLKEGGIYRRRSLLKAFPD